ncbi:p74 [Ectropis obliqua nucleopolyhedrovirus]|uniref:p74 n=1 Tax=Ectropis obliqua nucleopolyhedrovirus TaxID=59376 RepID=A0EYR7_9ABAC|nr:p74 [Ectropis obliqua nucleopolyhedrovirus]ABI35698.1 p74 [Ectropis obliqua nucleopolyhedrovirus]AGS47879.1 protein p74 [Ectropis obliqua nucleopolyhedrovirus]QWV59600.1 p74 [Ectropis obliqua nucleopolyhedrovirus]UYO72806.1 p74 [Ectropis obliqua nucleopolyhedrovirus]
MATLTTTDLTNASRYATHQHRLKFINRWRNKFPHILIDYEIRPATNDDFYVPPTLANRAIAVKLTFSRRGCESMTCYPFNETAPIDYNTPFGYTQTSETSVAYAQPACYNLDRAAATREGGENEIQAPELRYTSGNKCILVDTLSKMYLNSPYLRTDEHLIQGVDDVPGFNVKPTDSDSLFPEMFSGEFNQAYCRRFGRTLNDGGCSMQWWESLIGFVLGDTIYITFKLLANNIFSELRNFDYTRPSPELPVKPVVDAQQVLNDWRSVRDTRVDLQFENSFDTYETLNDLRINAFTKLVYTADQGFATLPFAREQLRFRTHTLTDAAAAQNSFDVTEDDLEFIISQFLEDHALIFGIWVSFGFDNVVDAMKFMLKKINTTLIPAMKQMLLTTSKRITVKMLGETYKAAIVHQFNRVAIKTISAVAKALTKITIKAASVVGILLIILTLTDLVLALWDPFGYGNMFPRQFPDDLSNSFLTAFFESMGETRDMLEFIPEYFDELVETDDVEIFDSLLYILDYISELEINSNGQMLNFDQSAVIDDFDEVTLVGSALSSSALYTKLDFMQYTQRFNATLYQNDDATIDTILAGLFSISAILILVNNSQDYRHLILFFIFVLLALYLLIRTSFRFYVNLRAFVSTARPKWYQNLYT